MAALSVVMAAIALAGWAWLARAGRRTERAAPPLDAVAPDPHAPFVSVVVPCRNEERDVESALRSLLSQDLTELQVIAVDDRSEDGTGAILDRIAAEDPRVTVIHVDVLPPGWLGKNHACAVGARSARGDWLLFTDADVLLQRDAIRRAVAFARARGLGHVAVAPRLVAGGVLERAFVAMFVVVAAAGFRCWDLARPGTDAYVGVGAFNLVRRDEYEAVGGHARLALEVVDDLKLGLLLRRSGVPQAFASGGALVRVRWQRGFVATVLGLVKNAFAVVEYRDGAAVTAAGALIFLGVAPLTLAIAAPSWAARVLGAMALLLAATVHASVARGVAAGTGVEGLLAPMMIVLLGAVLVASAATARLRGVVVWRGTPYPLPVLRDGCLRSSGLPSSGAPGWPCGGDGGDVGRSSKTR